MTRHLAASVLCLISTAILLAANCVAQSYTMPDLGASVGT